MLNEVKSRNAGFIELKDKTTKRLSPVKAIKAKCLDCSGGSKKEVRECIIQDCPLYTFRLGKNPNRKLKKNGFSTTEKKSIGKVEHKAVFETSLFEK
ncbi:MAG: hypothetical protein AB1521_10650 [Bacteroidota bacterium]